MWERYTTIKTMSKILFDKNYILNWYMFSFFSFKYIRYLLIQFIQEFILCNFVCRLLFEYINLYVKY